ncbi:hypothetical protein [Longibacter salinarum]|uniref:hypothetical protein n=1 Tax=Longibacter salinarum TaxID=1850348 RepID=UPI0015CF650F|nr:hypothetical protein [Longibacter salinarum]
MPEQRSDLRNRLTSIDARVIRWLERYGHRLHRVSLGALFVWLGLLKPLGHKTATSLLAHTVYWGSPETMVQILGWWEIAIGLSMLYRPTVRLALALLLLRIPGTLLAFVLLPDVTFVSFPFVPTPEGQYLIKDVVLFFAAMAIGGSLRHEHA